MRHTELLCALCTIFLCSVAKVVDVAHQELRVSAQSSRAFVISFNDTRFNHTRLLLSTCGFDVIRVWPVPTDEPSLLDLGDVENDEVQRRTLSHLMTYRHALKLGAADVETPDDGYFMVFEDDVALDPSVRPEDVRAIALHAARNSEHAGVFYLGFVCAWYLAADVSSPAAHSRAPGRLEWQNEGIGFARAWGDGSHAVGVHKRRAMWLWDELLERRAHSTLFDGCRYAIDMYLATAHMVQYSLHHKPVLAGTHLLQQAGLRHGAGACSPGVDAGYGIFYQASGDMPSQRQGHIPMPSLRTLMRSAAAANSRLTAAEVMPPLQPPSVRISIRCSWVVSLGGATAGSRRAAQALHAPLQMLAESANVKQLHALAVVSWRALTRGGPPSGAPDLTSLRQIMHHRRAWAALATNSSVEDDDYVVIVDSRWDVQATLSAGDTAAAIRLAAAASHRAGIFFLGGCGSVATAPVAWTHDNVALNRSLPDCVAAYGIYKWRAAWLWDVARAQFEGRSDGILHPTATLTLDRTLLIGLGKILAAADWPVRADVFESACVRPCRGRA